MSRAGFGGAGIVLLMLMGLCAGLGGCLGNNDPVVSTYDEGTVCISTDYDGSGLVAYVTVTFPTCLSSSCDSVLDRTCRLTIDEDTIVISADATVETSGTTCTADCGLLTTGCRIDVEPSTYSIQYGDRTEEVTFSIASASTSFVFFEDSGGGASCFSRITD